MTLPSHFSRRGLRGFLGVVGAAIVLTSLGSAQESQPAPPPPQPGAPVRLFKNFIQDGGIQPNVWLEGQWRLENNAPLFNGDDGTRNTLSGILTLGFNHRAEAGLSWGGIEVDPDDGSSESGASDLEIYGKALLKETPLNVSVGLLVKVPTADSDKQLGSGSADWEVFAGVRKDFGNIQAIGDLGVRVNGDPDVPGVNGETSALAGGGVIFALGRRSFGSLELSYESRRYSGLSTDFRMMPGLFLRLGERGFFRAAFGVGLSDGAPDTEAIAAFGWAY